jgi:Tfp pilus assembly protein PilO
VEVRMSLSKRELLILGSLVAVAVLVYVLVLLPTSNERGRLAAEADRLSRESQSIQEALRVIPQGREGLEEARRRLEEIRARLLPPGGLSSLYGEISRPSKRLGVRIVSFTPKGPDPAQHGQVLADLIVEGKYLELGKYLEELFAGQYLLSVSNLQLQAVKTGEPLLRMHVTLRTWMQQESSG